MQKHTMQEYAFQPLDLLRSISLNSSHIYMLVQNSMYPPTIHRTHGLFLVLVQAVMVACQGKFTGSWHPSN